MNENVKYYHGTTSLYEIGEYLDPTSKNTNLKTLYKRRTAKVSITNNLDTAIYYAKKSAEENGGEPVVYEVEPNIFMLLRVGKNIFITDKAKILGKVEAEVNENTEGKV